MNENMEADKFAKELDSLLAGKKGGEALDAELAKDMEFAEKLVCSDKSGESQVKRSLKEKLLAQTQRKPTRLESWGVRPWVFCAGLATLLLSPLIGYRMIRQEDAASVALKTRLSYPAAQAKTESPLGYVMPQAASVPFAADTGAGQMLAGAGRGVAGSASPISAGNVPNRAGSSNSLQSVDGVPGYMGIGVRGAKGMESGSLEDLKKMAERAGSVIDRQGAAATSLETETDRSGWNPGRSLAQRQLGRAVAMARASHRGAIETAAGRGMSDIGGDGMGAAGRTYDGNSGRDSKALGESLAFLAAKAAEQRAMEQGRALNGESERYPKLMEGEFLKAGAHPLSTFSIDVDVASYANMRRFLRQDRLPPSDSVRIEEFINYFKYDYPEPQHGQPFVIAADVAENPWHAKYKLVRVAIKGKTIPKAELPPSNLVFLIDSSGSMQDANKLPLVQKALRLLVEELRPQDRVSIVTYASSAKVVLGATSGGRKAEILSAIDKLRADGSTAGADGLQLAYRVAERSLAAKGNNRVILATDGDFNVGVSDDAGIVRLIEGERNKGVFLTVLGVGQGNYQDAKMQQLADKGNGNYAYLDDIEEAHKVLVAQLSGTLQAVAKDVKIQVEFNPARVQAYRLIGYEKRALQTEDFRNDKADAGELGAGHSVTALYEVIPVGVATDLPAVDSLRYQKPDASQELLAVKVRFKDPDGTQSRLLVQPLVDEFRPWSQASPDFKFASAVAGFGMLLRGSVHAKDLTYDKVYRMAQKSGGNDADGTRGEFLRLVEKARLLKGVDAR